MYVCIFCYKMAFKCAFLTRVLNTELPYLQGCNDILARFLLVLESEVDCYWIFKMYVEKRKNDFTEEGMIKKTGEEVSGQI